MAGIVYTALVPGLFQDPETGNAVRIFIARSQWYKAHVSERQVLAEFHVLAYRIVDNIFKHFSGEYPGPLLAVPADFQVICDYASVRTSFLRLVEESLCLRYFSEIKTEDFICSHGFSLAARIIPSFRLSHDIIQEKSESVQKRTGIGFFYIDSYC